MNNFLHFNQKLTAFLCFIYQYCIFKIIMIKFTYKKANDAPNFETFKRERNDANE